MTTVYDMSPSVNCERAILYSLKQKYTQTHRHTTSQCFINKLFHCIELSRSDHMSPSAHAASFSDCLLKWIMCVYSVCVCVCVCEGRGGQHGASEGARSGCSGVREMSQQQSYLQPRSLVLPLQVNLPTIHCTHTAQLHLQIAKG